MAVLELIDMGGHHRFDEAQCVAEGRRRSDAYRMAKPFPHARIDDFLDPDLLRRLATEFPKREDRECFDRPQERLKYQFDPNRSDSPLIRNLMASLNSAPFLAFLTELTGIAGLIADPGFSGGGLHETLPGGHLSIHADFNRHPSLAVERRLNLLIYLNDDWDEGFGGALEFWDDGMRAAAASIAPLMARAVIFDTTARSFHGHPDALRCPPGRSRRSIATYYYTAFAGEAAPSRLTTFRRRRGTGDSRDWATLYAHFVEDWVPPRLQPLAKRLIYR